MRSRCPSAAPRGSRSRTSSCWARARSSFLYLFVVRRWSASRAAYDFVVIPLVTIVLSAWIDDEPIGAGLVLGGLLVLAGVYVGALRPAES